MEKKLFSYWKIEHPDWDDPMYVSTECSEQMTKSFALAVTLTNLNLPPGADYKKAHITHVFRKEEIVDEWNG